MFQKNHPMAPAIIKKEYTRIFQDYLEIIRKELMRNPFLLCNV